MELKINNKIYACRYNDKGELIISLDNEPDIQFFKEWENKKAQVIQKKDYVKDIPIFKTNEYGILKNCFPILNLNENIVKIVYDFYGYKTLIL